jgi:hypothetical protein
MQIKKYNPLQALKVNATINAHLPRARSMILFCVLIFGLGFYLGGYTPAPASIESRIKEISRTNFTVLKNYVRGKMSQPKKMTIDIKHKDYQYLEFKRAQALQRGVLITDDESFVPAWVTVDGKRTKAKMRLKGDITDHLEGDKWSFRIQVKGGKTIWGMRRFSIQAPERSGWGHEWVMYQWFRKEGLISLRYDFIELTINGKRRGLFAMEESFGKELLENNQRREGPILKWDESLLFDNRKVTKGDWLEETDLFQAADVLSFSTTKMLTNKSLRDNFLWGRHMLTALRKGQARLGEVFDVERAAKTVAILRMQNVLHGFRWKNCRFYVNPVTRKLELIAYNAYAPHPIVPIKRNSIPVYTAHRQKLMTSGVQEWRDLFFSDPEFIKHYFAALDRFTSPGYLESFFNDISRDLKKKESFIFKDEPSRGVLVPVYFHNRDIMRSFLYPKLPLKAYLNQYDQQTMRLSVANPRYFPVIIDGIVLKPSGQLLAVSSPARLEGKDMGKPLGFMAVEVPAADIGKSILSRVRNGDTMILDDIQIKYHTPGVKAHSLAPVDAYPLFFSSHFMSTEESQRRLEELIENGTVNIDDDRMEIIFKPGAWAIEKNVVIPKGYKMTVVPGSQLILNKGAAIISYGSVQLNGTFQMPVVLKSTDGSGQGLVVISADNQSKLSHVIFDNLTSLASKSWNLTGAVTFYESKLEIDNVKFINNHSEDHLNIIRSQFAIRNSLFMESSGDALDVDFGEGTISKTRFESCGNDCLDFSGSKVRIRNLVIKGAGDKGVSVGEKSQVSVIKSSVSDATIALACKDMSKTLADDMRIVDSKIGFAVYQKKSEFGGAQIYGRNIVMTNVNNKYVGDSQSGIFENDRVVAVNASALQGIIQQRR